MKKMKKLAALVLALVMAFSLMAVTAAAAGAEERGNDPAETAGGAVPEVRYHNGRLDKYQQQWRKMC